VIFNAFHIDVFYRDFWYAGAIFPEERPASSKRS